MAGKSRKFKRDKKVNGQVKRGRGKVIRGVIEKHSRGFGFIRVDDGDDIFVPRRAMNGAMNGDLVEAEPTAPGKKDSLSGEARITKVIDRNYNEVVGKLVRSDGHAFVEPINKHNNDDIYIAKNNLNKAKNGDMVLVKILRYPQRRLSAEGRVVEIIAKRTDDDAKILGLIREYGLSTEFKRGTIDDAKKIPEKIGAKQIAKRRDLRDLTTVTIDGADSRDFDDAVSLQMMDSGNYLLFVHIADVSEYVQEGTYLDKEAFKRGNSVYLPDRVIPMLPEKLSNGICSLNPGEDRLTLTCEMEVDADANVVRHKIDETVIRSDARMVYDDVSDMLENDDEVLKKKYSAIYPMLVKMRDLAAALNKSRRRTGSIDFELPETKISVDRNGDPVYIGPESRRVANRLIEEFMLLANKTVAKHYFHLNCPFVYRVHEKPEPTKVIELRDFLAGFGINIAQKTDSVSPKELSTVLDKVQDTPAENLVNRVMIRAMQKADYRPECLGHYGLAFKYYCHFTSPIRRYPDLFIHRVIKEIIANGDITSRKAHYAEEAARVSERSSATERNAMELEREVEKMIKVRYMSEHVGETFDGVISGVTANGLYVELANTIEGFVRYDSLDDFYTFDEKNFKAVAADTGRTYAMGDSVTIDVAGTNEEDSLIDFVMSGKKK